MNQLTEDLNAVIKRAAESLNGIGVIYVDGFQDSFNGHRFCEPDTQKYLKYPLGSKTWFWHDDASMAPGEGPDTVVELSDPSPGGSNLTQEALDLLIPDQGQQASLSASNPPENINKAFADYDAFLAAIDEAEGDANVSAQVPLTERVIRSFHPKGTGYQQQAAAFMAAIKANRVPVGASSGEVSPPSPPEATPADPPSPAHCNDKPDNDVRTSRKIQMGYAAGYFCADIAKDIVPGPDVAIHKTIIAADGERDKAKEYDGKATDDVYMFEINSRKDCPQDGGYSVAEPLPNVKCANLMHDAWDQCKCHPEENRDGKSADSDPR